MGRWPVLSRTTRSGTRCRARSRGRSPRPTDQTARMPPVVRLETERLVLRQFRDDDLDAYIGMVNHPDVMKAMGDAEPRTREQCWRTMALYLGHWAMRGFGPFAVE